MSARSGLVGKNPLGVIWAHVGPFFAWAGKIRKIVFSLIFLLFFALFRPTQKRAQMDPNGARRFFFPTNPDLADILGRTDLDFENFIFFGFCWVPNFWLGPILGPPTWAWLGLAHLGSAWATHLGPSGGPAPAISA